MDYLIVIVIWALYCFFHSFLISIWFTNILTRLLKKYFSYYRMFYVLVSILLLIPLINYTSKIDSSAVSIYEFPVSIIRSVLFYGSLLIFFWAFFFNYDSLSFFGIRQVINRNKAGLKPGSNEIKKNGLLGIIRHPMYLALIIFLWCQTYRMLDIVVNTLLTIYVLIGTRLEERKLVLEYGDAYKKYQLEVPMLIPFTKPKVS